VAVVDVVVVAAAAGTRAVRGTRATARTATRRSARRSNSKCSAAKMHESLWEGRLREECLPGPSVAVTRAAAVRHDGLEMLNHQASAWRAPCSVAAHRAPRFVQALAALPKMLEK
jgi:hypothetical protein